MNVARQRRPRRRSFAVVDHQAPGDQSQAKGILMERHKIAEQRAFALLRSHARKTNQKVTDFAKAITTGYLLLPDHPNGA